jgi:hypothetical protein
VVARDLAEAVGATIESGIINGNGTTPTRSA